MKKLFLSLNLTLCGLLAFAQPNPIKKLTPAKITFETEIIDYGTIEKGSDGEREFVFTNTGNAPLIISEAKKTCGCTVPSWPKEPIKPGKSAIINVKYDTKRIGTINKSVIVLSNAKRPSVTLRIKGKVIEYQSTLSTNSTGKPLAK